MDSEISLVKCRDVLMHHHYSEWEFKKSCLNSPSVKTEVFFPVPNSDVAFYFELWYKEFNLDSRTAYSFKINFVKSCGIDIPQLMKLNLKIAITNFHNPKRVFREYEHDDIHVESMSTVTIADEIFYQYVYDTNGVPQSCNANAFLQDFSLECSLAFHDHLDTPATYCKHVRSLKNMCEFANEFHSLFKEKSQTSLSESENQFHDVEIKIGEETIFAHKTMLVSHSPVFLKMFSHDFSESKTNVIDISDVSAETFRSFLEYFYSGQISDKSWTAVKELYALADKYDVCSLKRECGEISSNYLSVDSACEILEMAYDYGDDYLKFEAKKFAFKHIKELRPRRDWKEMIQYNPLIGYEVMQKYDPELD